MKCTNCDSSNVVKRGTISNSNKQRYKCKSCFKWFSSTNSKQEQLAETSKFDLNRPKKYVITACQNNAAINEDFAYSLQAYCKFNNAELLVVPIIYRPNDHEDIVFNIPSWLEHTLINSKVRIHDEVFVMGSFNFVPTTVNPLQGLESLSRGDTLIVPSPQLRMKSMAVSATRHPAILHTTGAISNPEYSNTKVGEKALFNHSYSAVVVEIDNDNDFHIRVLSADDFGAFFDIGYLYTPRGDVSFEGIEALVTGDEHAIFADPVVTNATYLGDASIVKTLKPKYVVRGDVLDCFAVNHHSRKNTLKNIGKSIFNLNKIEDELKRTIEHIELTTSSGDFENILVASNHADHLTEWLSNIDIKTEPWNAKIYFWLMYHVVDSMEKTESGVSHNDPFEIYCKSVGLLKTRFLSRDESFKIGDVELSMHGDRGQSGSRGSIAQFANLCDKVVIGHSHTPGIIGGAYQVGTSSYKKLDYTSGLSSWMQTHCIIYPSGKRQLINIINGKWKS